MVDNRSASNERDRFEPLLELATPRVYEQVAFRLLELPADAGERDLERRRELMEKAARSGLAVPQGAGRLLPLAQASDEHALRAAAHAVQDARRRFAHELLWFWPLAAGPAANDAALRHLAAGEAEAAAAVWRGTQGDQRATARHNLAVWHHLSAVEGERALMIAKAEAPPAAQAALDAHWQAAHEHWRAVVDDESFWKVVAARRIARIDDPSLRPDVLDVARQTLPVALVLVAARLAMQAMDAGREGQAQRLARQVARCGFQERAVAEALGTAVEPLRSLCLSLRQEALDRSSATPLDGAAAAEHLLDRAAVPLAVLDRLLAAEHPARQAERDEVADIALTCAIRFYNADGSPRRAVAVIDRLTPLACGEAVRNRIQHERAIQARYLAALTCWTCGENDGADECALEVKLFGDVQNEATPGGTRTTWNYSAIKVPRCRQCVDEEGRMARSGGIAVLALTAGLAGAVALFITRSEIVGLAAGAAAILAALGLAWHERRVRLRKCRPQIERRARNDHPAIKERLDKGWQFGERPIGTTA